MDGHWPHWGERLWRGCQAVPGWHDPYVAPAATPLPEPDVPVAPAGPRQVSLTWWPEDFEHQDFGDLEAG